MLFQAELCILEEVSLNIRHLKWRLGSIQRLAIHFTALTERALCPDSVIRDGTHTASRLLNIRCIDSCSCLRATFMTLLVNISRIIREPI